MLLFLLVLSPSACGLDFGGGGSTTATTHRGSTRSTPTASGARIQFGTQPCPDAAKDTVKWKGVLGIGADRTQTVERVICGYLMGVPELQAVVGVRHAGNDQVLDVFVYTDITSGSSTVLFTLGGLVHGDVRISGYNTVLTAQVDPHSSLNSGQASTGLEEDLFREFKWSDSAGTFVPIAFTGLFPDLTRFQAELEQEQVNAGQGFQQWRLDVVKSAQTFVNSFLNWAPNVPVTVVSGGGLHDYQAVVLVKNTGGGSVRISFRRLEGNANGGLWEATAIESDGLSIMVPQSGQSVTSPIMVKGVNKGFVGKGLVIKVLDHFHTDIGHMTIAGSAGGKGDFSEQVSYTSSFSRGTQEGIVGVYAYNGDESIAGVVWVKVLLGG